MAPFVQFAAIEEMAVVERIGEKIHDRREMERSPVLGSKAEREHLVADRRERVVSGRKQFEGFLRFEKRLRIGFDSPQARLVEIAERSFAGKHAVPYLLPDAAQDILAEVVAVILGLPEGDREHEFPLRRGFKPKRREFERHDLYGINKVDDLSAVYRIASQPVGMPRNDAGGDPFLYLVYHLVEDRAAGFLRTLALGVFPNYMNIILTRERAKLSKLGFDRQYLTFLLFGGFAGIEEKVDHNSIDVNVIYVTLFINT